MSATPRATATLLPDRGAAARAEEFFRCAEFLEAEGVTHTLLLEGAASRAAIPLLVREIEGSGGALDASSPYAYPGGSSEGEPLDAGAIDFSATGLVSVFIRERLGEPPTLLGAQDRSLVLVADPELPRKSRMSDRQQIRKNEAAGYAIEQLPGSESTPAQRAAFGAVYAETMDRLQASERYLFPPSYFDLLLGSSQARLFLAVAPDGEVAAAAIAAVSDGFLHYYLSGTADAHLRRAPSKNLIAAVTDHAESLGLPMNLGGGIKPGDGLEEFKRGFANRELPFRTHQLICDAQRYDELSAGREGADFFPLYRA